MLLSSSLKAGGQRAFLFHKGSSLVFRENNGELHSPLATHPFENLQLELTADSLAPVPALCVQCLPHSGPHFPHFTRALTGEALTMQEGPRQGLTWPVSGSMKHLPG